MLWQFVDALGQVAVAAALLYGLIWLAGRIR